MASPTKPPPATKFISAVAVLTDLDAPLRTALSRLVTSRLVIVSRSPDGVEVADLAHQALITQWPRLHGWLIEERDFRDWQESLRTDLTRWEANGRDSGGLLRGAPLATAIRWTREHPEDIGAAERGYIRASRGRAQRRVRVLWSVVAVISVLALAAGSLAVLAARQTAQADARLRTAASRALADDSNRLRRTDPAASLQLAQAAWHHDRTAEASGALFAWYAALQSVDRVDRNLWEGDISAIEASRDGSVVAFVNSSGLPSVWTGLTGDAPQRWQLPNGGLSLPGGEFAISPDGRHIGYTNPLGGVVLWNVESRSGPIHLAEPEPPGELADEIRRQSVMFSSDGSRLLVWAENWNDGSAAIRLWNVADGRRLPAVSPIRPDDSINSVSFGPTPTTLLVTALGSTRLYDLGTGRLVRTVPSGRYDLTRPAANGALMSRCDDRRLRVLAGTTGSEQRSIAVASCSYEINLDNASEYRVLAESPEDEESNTFLAVADLRTGRTYRLSAPPVDLNDYPRPGVVSVFRGPKGHPIVILADRNQAYRLRPDAPEPLTVPTGEDESDMTLGSVRLPRPDGRLEVWIDGATGRINLRDTTSRKTLATANAPPTPDAKKVGFKGVWYAFSPDGKRFLMVQGDSLVSYSVPDLAVEHRIPLPVQDGLGPPLRDVGLSAWASSVMADNEGRATVLHAGQLTRWDLATGKPVGSPLPLRTELSGQRRSALLAILAPPARPRRPGEVAVIESNGDVEIWNLDRRRMVATLSGDAELRQGSVVFDQSGSRIATYARNGRITVWNIADDPPSSSVVPTGQVDALLGFTSDGALLTLRRKLPPTALQLWDEASGKLLATLTVPGYSPTVSLTGDGLRVGAAGRTRSLPMAPAAWIGRLCSLNDRRYTDVEKQVLDRHSGTTEEPCG